jgi:NTP pyrophosphatase (non-canonical NTP hydrolase)
MSFNTKIEPKDIFVKLADLYRQATTEQSHFYTAACVKEAMKEIASLRLRIVRPIKAVDLLPDWIVIVKAERQRQDAKWEEQNHDDFKWLSILMEEVGEVSKAALEHDEPEVLKELSHVAAVAVAHIEALGRRAAKKEAV